MENDLVTLLALTRLDGVGDARALELFRAFATRDILLESPLEAFEEYHYVDADTHSQLQSLDSVISEIAARLNRYRDRGIDVVGLDDTRYPTPLRYQHAPLVLYCKGDVALLESESVSVSGSRETNDCGLDWTREITGELASDGYTIVSGGALGADTAAHQGALDVTGKTIVVLGTGVDVPYPKSNEVLFSEIVDADGLLISHRPPDAEPTRHAFIDRNQTISAMSTGILFVATDGSGGTQAQYRIARDQGRQVFVPPAEQQIEPADGTNELRVAEGTLIASSATGVSAELPSKFPFERDATTTDEQTDLSDW